MPARNPDLHGNAPDKADVALLLIDVINALEFKEGPARLKKAAPMAERIARLKRRAKRANVPVIYVNDNFGKWGPTLRSSSPTVCATAFGEARWFAGCSLKRMIISC